MFLATSILHFTIEKAPLTPAPPAIPDTLLATTPGGHRLGIHSNHRALRSPLSLPTRGRCPDILCLQADCGAALAVHPLSLMHQITACIPQDHCSGIHPKLKGGVKLLLSHGAFWMPRSTHYQPKMKPPSPASPLEKEVTMSRLKGPESNTRGVCTKGHSFVHYIYQCIYMHGNLQIYLYGYYFSHNRSYCIPRVKGPIRP